ncbi:sugar phosphate isomerase/epimerase family protein [Pseudomonas fulva]|uniref:sugar phosphate isomerase/epimerase family protein n=1 Tax=Pseudomonas fulva TaxID=47880 RepID=UPI0018AB92A1|nr:sugar phosphate isomerase/epimerase family protein [Pseudomonas fulva]MBF8774067.1 sugar phosphate isomerase/epimerase [Pseudomonas fulva]
MSLNELAFHCTVARHGTVALDVNIAKSAGFSAIEMSGSKLQKYFDVGYEAADLKALLTGFSVPGIGYLRDIERTGRLESELMKDAEELFTLAAAAGAKGVQVLTGPINVQAVIDHKEGKQSQFYSGLLGRDLEEQKKVTANNLRRLADLASQFNLVLYLEALAWTPMTGLSHQTELIDRADRRNVKMVIDFWHCYTSGDTPEDISRMDKNYLYGVHVCDSLRFDGGIPNEDILRDVPTGEGVLNLKEWTDAVKSTGYQGWWSCELFCLKQHQGDSFKVAQDHFKLLNNLVNG